ncbi:MAG: Holliday junction branch migration protein RuvA, partial [Bacteroidota bacterium]
MYAYIKGVLAHKDPTYVVIDVQGVGYEVRISLNTYEALEKESTYKLHTYLHVKEDAQTLFGFAQPAEKKLFLDLLSISGVGPSLALTLLSSMQV